MQSTSRVKHHFSATFLGIGAVLLFLASPIRAEDPPAHLKPPTGVSEEEFRTAFRQASALETVFRAIYENVRPSVVQVVVESTVKVASDQEYVDPFLRRFFGDQEPNGRKQRDRVQKAEGSGFILDEAGFIVTNSHVVGKNSKVQVKLSDGRVIDGTVRGSDPLSDIALIEIKGVKGLKPARLGDSDKIRVGDMAIAVGNPFGLEATFTTGVISAVGRTGLDRSGMKFLQTDASINQGNSGGPLLNLRGEVIGINRMIIAPSGGSVGIGFSIPTNEIQTVIQQIKEKGFVARPILGVQIAPIPDAMKTQTGNKGVFVVSVVMNSGAAKAGIEPEDIILKADEHSIDKPEDLIRYIRTKNVGDKVKLEVQRGTQVRKVSVQLGQLEN